ncbi:helix-turn-helix domain-containing protein [Brevibacterium aurantiacum]|uniref:Helix-turn-helix domain-containing protein n=1 Tax=Brevibacterium aurantiacum TaxID=273384 RepID=A0A556CAL6_BREAU|nr:helix-turn-helix domain-containing protein [Brevibacterium aurantiacum]TSI14495.1 helix-turn-helix domain-containing protein [Brevibacterium aurantiacum]
MTVAVTQAPPIPPSRMGASWLHDLNLLLWVRSGCAEIRTEGGAVERVHAGQGIWMPAGPSMTVTTKAETVAFPYPVPRGVDPEAPSRIVRFAVPEQWQDWLILHFVQGSTTLRVFGYSPETLSGALGIADATRPSAAPGWVPGDQPPMPSAAGAHAVARELRANPALDHSLDEWAKLTTSSVSSLRRGFLAGGRPFELWRTLTRLAAGCDYLAAGFDIEHTATLVGFSSRNGFTRAFGHCYGITPSNYAVRAAASYRGSTFRVAAARGTAALARILGRTGAYDASPAVTRELPSTHTSWHANDLHVLAWIYKGQGFLRIGEYHHRRREGEAVWIPAGVDHQAGNHEGSIGLPIAYLDPKDLRMTEPMRAQFPPSWNDYLLHRVIATRSMLRPSEFDPRAILDLFAEQLAMQRTRAVPMPTDQRARTVAADFLAGMRWPAAYRIDAGVHEVFRSETGMTIARWQHVARMQIAAELLEAGAAPSIVARRVGYAHPRSFSRAFRSSYQMTPSEYCKRSERCGLSG